MSGITGPKPANDAVEEVELAVEAVVKATTRLLENLPERGAARTREGEKERAKKRWMARETRIVDARTGTGTRTTRKRSASS